MLFNSIDFFVFYAVHGAIGMCRCYIKNGIFSIDLQRRDSFA